MLSAHFDYVLGSIAWGNCIVEEIGKAAISCGLGYMNPIRYRGYYYDYNLGLYDLTTRYYDPETGRFTSADTVDYLAPDSVNGLNLYAYCGNNPVMYCDPSGHFVLLTFWICVGAGMVLGGLLGGYTADKKGGDVWAGILSGALLGAAVGAIIGIGGATLAAALSSTASKAVTDIISVAFYGGDLGTWEDYAIAFVLGGAKAGVGQIAVLAKASKAIEFAIDVVVRPLANQAIKVATRGNSIDGQKYAYDVVTRALTFGGTDSIMSGSFRGLQLKVDLGKSFYRATTKFIYSYYSG